MKFICQDIMKVFNCKKTILILLVAIGCSEKEPELVIVTNENIDVKDNVFYLKSTDKVFNGYLTDYYTSSSSQEPNVENKNIKSRSLIRNGKLNGLSEGWYTSGQKQIEENFVDGKSHGVRVKWHRNGLKSAEDTIEYGILNGLCRKWHQNGQLAEEMVMVNGKADGRAFSWHVNGRRKAEVELRMGKVIEQKLWHKNGDSVHSQSSGKG